MFLAQRWYEMELLKKHVDTVVVLGGILASVLWMNGKFNEIDKRFSIVEKDMAVLKSDVEKEIAIIKAILIIKNLMPVELAHHVEE